MVPKKIPKEPNALTFNLIGQQAIQAGIDPVTDEVAPQSQLPVIPPFVSNKDAICLSNVSWLSINCLHSPIWSVQARVRSTIFVTLFLH